jgi:hypothetical protein
MLRRNLLMHRRILMLISALMMPKVWISAFTNPCLLLCITVATNGHWIHFLANALLVHLTESCVSLLHLNLLATVIAVMSMIRIMLSFYWCIVGKMSVESDRTIRAWSIETVIPSFFILFFYFFLNFLQNLHVEGENLYF